MVRAGLVVVLMSTAALSCKAAPFCQNGIASAPFIGAASLRSITAAASRLPLAPRPSIRASIGMAVPIGIRRVPLPPAIARVLPQYGRPSYRAFRLGERLAIVDRRGTLVYLMPLRGTGQPRNCP